MAKVIYDRKNCIGAGTCIAAAPMHWKMNPDGKADLIGCKHNNQTDKDELELTDPQEIKENKEAAEVCPVNVIVVED